VFVGADDPGYSRTNTTITQQESDVFRSAFAFDEESAKGYQMIVRKREEESLQADSCASDGSNLVVDEEQPPPLFQDLRHQINRGSWNSLSEMMGEESIVFCGLHLGIAA
jgi:hypothetical protein